MLDVDEIILADSPGSLARRLELVAALLSLRIHENQEGFELESIRRYVFLGMEIRSS